MIKKNFIFKSDNGKDIFVYNWLPKDKKVKGIVQIAHGMAETAERYERFAKELNRHRYIVYDNDHRGHGKTAGNIENLGYLGGKDGFNWIVRDMYKLSNIIKEENPGLPLFLLGHSMGSFASQKYIMMYDNNLDGLILSGSNGEQGIKLKLGALLAKREVKKHGYKKKSPKLDKLTLGNFNKSFKPKRTKFDWISRDEDEVDKYINNPYCGTIFTVGFFYDFLNGLRDIEDKRNFHLIPKDLPIFIFSGDKDPVGNFGKGVKKLYKRYKFLGVKDVECKLYKDGRHEMLNEINRNEVMKDVIQWLNRQI